MTPLYLNSPPSSFQFGEQKDDQHLQLFLSSSHRSPSSLSCPTFFNKTQDQRMIKIEDDGKVGECIAGGGSSSDHVHVVSSSSSLQPVMDHVTNGYNQSLCKREVGEGNTSTDNGSAKWMSSKMRLMQKMMNANCTGTDESVKITRKFQYQMHEINSFSNSNTSSTFRICADCNTTTTPLWRSGPRGPKSLCNACGIRQRKARRAMEAAAANGTIAAATDTKIKVQISKEKKSRTSHVAQYKKQSNNKTPDPPLPPPHHHHQIQTQRKPCFKEFALNLSKNSAIKQVLPQDVEEAAILLMELSCGFIQS